MDENTKRLIPAMLRPKPQRKQVQGSGTHLPNPYVGPRAFELEDRANFFGRDAEIRQLADLVVAQRAVLLYAPSGAGKTSLINAGLIPALAQRRMAVLPVARVGGSAPAEARNPFVYNALAALLGEAADPEALLDLTLLEGMEMALAQLGEAAPGRHPRPMLLILDQFEEVFTLHPGQHAAREAFFAYLQAALEALPHLGLLLAMREEYLAYLDTFSAMLPDRLRTRFRLTLLDADAARLAIQGPAREQGVAFTDAAAHKLLDDLRQVQTQTLDGMTKTQPGQHVEPVQLQVVCRQIWERVMGNALAPATTIVESDIEAVGDVDAALATYYAQRVARAAAETGVAERAIRVWCEEHLITPQGLRGTVLLGTGLAPATVAKLEDAHLVRAEKRAGATWYELAHDRLVAPVRNDNTAWFEANLSLLQHQAALWEKKKRPVGLLLSGDALAEATAWAEEHADEVLEIEHNFLKACYAEQERVRRERTQNHRIRWLAAGATLFALITLVLMFFSWQQMQKAKKQAQISLARQLATQAQYILDQDETKLPRSILLVIESLRRYPEQTTNEILVSSLESLPYNVSQASHQDMVRDIAFSPSGQWMVSGSNDNTARVWETKTGREIARMKHEGWVNSVAFSPSGQWVVSGSDDNTARVWQASTGQEVARITHDEDVNIVTFSPDGRWVTSGSDDGTVRVWETETGQEISSMMHNGTVETIAFDPKGQWVASGGLDKTARVWEAKTGREIARTRHDGVVRIVIFSPDGHAVASGGDDSMVQIWESKTGRNIASMTHQDVVWTLAFSPDGQWLISGGRDNKARVWETKNGLEVTNMPHEQGVIVVGFSSDGQLVISGSRDGRVWIQGKEKERKILLKHANIGTIAFSSDGRWIVSGSDNGTIKVWDTLIAWEVARIPHAGWLISDAIRNHNGRWMISAKCDKTNAEEACTSSSAQDSGTRCMKGRVLWNLPPLEWLTENTEFSPDGQWIVSAGCDEFKLKYYGCVSHSAWVWQATTGHVVARMPHVGSVSSVDFGPNGKWVVSVACDKFSGGCVSSSVRVWEAITGHEVARMTYKGQVSSVNFSPDGQWIVSAGCDEFENHNCLSHSARVWEAITGREAARMTYKGWISSIDFSPDGQWVVSAGCDEFENHNCTNSSVRVWKAATGREVTRMTYGGGVSVVTFSPDGQWVVSVGCDEFENHDCLSHSARVWKATTGQEVTRKLHEENISSIDFSPNGRWIVSGSSDGIAHVWEAITGQEIAQMLHEGDISSIDFSPNGKWIVSGSSDGTAHVWEAATGREVTRMTHRGVSIVAFSPDGQWVLSGSAATARVWWWHPDDMIRLACERLTRNLTYEEWSQYLRDETYRATCPNLPMPEE